MLNVEWRERKKIIFLLRLTDFSYFFTRKNSLNSFSRSLTNSVWISAFFWYLLKEQPVVVVEWSVNQREISCQIMLTLSWWSTIFDRFLFYFSQKKGRKNKIITKHPDNAWCYFWLGQLASILRLTRLHNLFWPASVRTRQLWL